MSHNSSLCKGSYCAGERQSSGHARDEKYQMHARPHMHGPQRRSTIHETGVHGDSSASAPLGPTRGEARPQSRGELRRTGAASTAARHKSLSLEKEYSATSLQLPKLARIKTRVPRPSACATHDDDASAEAQTADIGALNHADDTGVVMRRRGGEGGDSAAPRGARRHTEWRGRAEEALRDLKLISSMLKSGDRERSTKTRKLVG